VDSKVSVIIPTYNRGRLLVETLDSVCAQTCRDYEIIVVDDGSGDDTRQLVTTYSDQLVYHRIDHAGVSAARNAGLDLACGEYVAFLDSDDLWEPRFLERMMDALDTAPEAGFGYCDYATFSARGTEQAAYLPPRQKVNGSIFSLLLETDFLSTGTLLIRRACFAWAGGFDLTLAVAQDWDLWLRLARACNAVYVDEPLVRIRIDSDGLTRETLQLNTDNLHVLAKWERAVRGNQRQRDVIRRNRRNCHNSLSRSYWAKNRPWPAFKHRVLSLASEFL
jgi:glycosyltransferase involved in cell wall biosynthesis